jgi:poly(hydroxyalkanoate) depolymerase family esterase
MNNILNTGLLKAARLTNVGRLTEATAALQRMLGAEHPAPFATRPTMPGALRARLDQGLGLRPAGTQISAPSGAQFLAGSFTNDAGTRPYKVYIPSGYQASQPVPLIVMLHGCTQSPDDFAAGTRMNEAAEKRTCIVVYPGQTASANMQKCWNWFTESDQHRGQGEPSLIAGITRQIMRDYAVDPSRVYVAGLSAGGAAAAIMGDAYPDLFAAIGVHSGLACGAARDMPSAFAAMKGSGMAAASSGANRRMVPAIVFHGDRDTTVVPSNAGAVVTQSAGSAVLSACSEQGQVPGGHAYLRTVRTDAAGRGVIEQWVVYGAGHAWSGGSAAGSYTDPRGPDATSEMLRFFLEHSL